MYELERVKGVTVVGVRGHLVAVEAHSVAESRRSP
jgi:hypothetical protein